MHAAVESVGIPALRADAPQIIQLSGKVAVSTPETARRWSPTGFGFTLTFVFFNVMLIIALWIAVIGVVHIDREKTVTTAVDRNNNLAIALEEYTTRTIESADSVLRYMIREYSLAGGKIDLDKFVRDFTISSSVFTGVVLADENGNISTTSYMGKPAKPVNVADREHFKVHVTQDTRAVFIGKPVTGRVTGKEVVPITRRINKPDGSFGGVMMVLIDYRNFTNMLQDAKMRPFDVFSVVGLDGITRSRLRGSVPGTGEDISKSPLFAEQVRHPDGNFFTKGQLDGVPKFFSYRTLPQYRLMTIVGSAEADVMADFSRRKRQYFWAAGLASTLIAAFTLALVLMLNRQRLAASIIARNQARFLATFNQAAVGIAHSDLEGRCLEINQKLCDITGYSREEMLGRKFTDITHPDDVEASHRLRRQVIDNPRTFDSQQREKRYIRKDGTTVWCLLTTSVVRDESGNIDYLAAVVQDITESKAAEDALRNLEHAQRQLALQAETERARLAEAQAVARMGSWETRFPDLTVSWSAQTHRIFGTDASRYQPTHAGFLEFVHPEDRAKVDAAFSSSIGDRSYNTIEHRIITPDGRIKIVEERWRTFCDDQGRPTRSVGTCQDITEKKKAEQDQAQLAAIVKSSNDAIISRSLDGLIQSWNPAAERMFGWTAEEILGKPARITSPPDQPLENDLKFLEPVKRGESITTFEAERIRKDGTRFDAQISLSAIKDGSGRIVAIAGIVRDITERKLAETALRDHAEQMRHLSMRLSAVEERERSDIHRELHDRIGSNLAALNIELGLISNMLAGLDLKVVCDRLQNAQRLLGETNSEIRDVMGSLRPPALDDFGLLAALRNCSKPQTARLGIPVTVDGDEIQPRLSIAVETALFRIAQEALINIAKHAQARQARITLSSTPDRVTLLVEDDGIGFSVGNVSPNADKWGLRTMRERALAINAALRIESSPGKGTRIVVELARETA